ncbi:hypothetical protein [Streptomyces sp. NBC_01373]|uniref:hypothetical protein n=1 Tax=Streptomyces sp. NBC_01373 TaxID=2903843 RepID=UPI0022550C83|nr:hypothetical protein [Streptomyces sp. NBC_01373]MCX4697044.1 hypothetical protein [Streptomyces sp. NBC_01373]MCX4707031.1 hypothetical protein [Streptomyces sp. NBC_01373]
MTPEQIDAATNGALWASAQIDTYGPGFGVAGGIWAAWWANRRITRAVRRRRAVPRTIRQLEAFANDTANRARREDTP